MDRPSLLKFSIAFNAAYQMASSLVSPTFHWKRDPWVTTPPPKSIEKSVVAQSLDGAHQVVFKRAMANILATELAGLTFAQLIDGLPLWDVAMDQSRKTHTKEEPVYNHKQLCHGAMEKMREMREQFDPLAMEVRADVSLASRSKLPSLRVKGLTSAHRL